MHLKLNSIEIIGKLPLAGFRRDRYSVSEAFGILLICSRSEARYFECELILVL